MDDAVEDAKAFWEMVGTPREFHTLEVGETVLIEDPRHGTKRVAVCVAVETVDGERTFHFRDPEVGEQLTSPPTVLVIG